MLRRTPLLAVLLLVAAAGRGSDLVPGLGDPDPRERRRAVGRLERTAGLAALRALLDCLADEDPGVQERAVGALAARTVPREREWLAGVARRDPREAVREGLARALGGDAQAADVLADLVRDRAAAVREAAARGLGEVGTAAHLDALRAALRDRRPGPRIAALEALDRLDPGETPARARAFLADEDPDARVAAVLLLTERRDGEPDTALLNALGDPSWSVRIAAARAVTRLRIADAVPRLVTALEQEQGRVREEVHRALAGLTGIGLPDDPARWRDWWAREAERFVPATRPGEPPPSGHESAVTYHSIPVTSRAVTFVLDASRSMLEPAEGDDGPTRRERALEELEATLRRLDRRTRFNLVLFGERIVRWLPSPRPSTPAAVTAALEDARRVPPGGWTDLYGALEAAFSDREVDTVYVLTDGAPSAGRHVSRTGLLEAVARLNRYRLVRIHTIGLGTGSVGQRWRGFLGDLARAHDGIHVAR